MSDFDTRFRMIDATLDRAERHLEAARAHLNAAHGTLYRWRIAWRRLTA